MPSNSDWSRPENLAVIDAYASLLQAELRGESANKAATMRSIQPELQSRSISAIEYKFRNLSAILETHEWKYLSGYVPAEHFQADLETALMTRLIETPGILADAIVDADQTPPQPPQEDILSRLRAAPHLQHKIRTDNVVRDSIEAPTRGQLPSMFDREAANRRLGLRGEEFVVDYERARLAHAGKDRLSRSVEHVAITLGDGLGFDIKSYNFDGSDLFIEVKTTKYANTTPFFISQNEISFSKARSIRYSLYRVYKFGPQTELYMLPGAVEVSCSLTVSQFRAWPE